MLFPLKLFPFPISSPKPFPFPWESHGNGNSYSHAHMYFGYVAAFSNECGSKLSEVLNDVTFRTTTKPPEYIILMAIHCAAAKHGGLIKKIKSKSKVHG